MDSQHLLTDLIGKVAEFCRSRRGRVSQLAADLGVSQPHVSLWLTHRQTPNGEYTLRLQRWLHQQHEAEAKAAQAADDQVRESLARIAANRKTVA